jgi:hypothetical protein
MINRIAQIEAELKNYNISRDAYELWKDNIVTQRFFRGLELQLLEAREDYSAAGRDSIEKIALASVVNANFCETLEGVLSWIPQELSSDE